MAVELVFVREDMHTIAITEVGNVNVTSSLQALALVGASNRSMLSLVCLNQLIWWI